MMAAIMLGQSNSTDLLLSRRHFSMGICAGPLWYVCGARATLQTVIEVSKLLLAAIDLFETSLTDYHAAVRKATRGLRSELQQNGKNLASVALKWEAEQSPVTDRASDLRTKFNDVSGKASNYWSLLGEITDELSDVATREREQKRNQELREHWDKAYLIAQGKLDEIDRIRDKSKDVGRLLAIAALRSDLARFSESVEDISKQADSLLISLKSFTREGKATLQLAVAK
jgi:hypothetical protein